MAFQIRDKIFFLFTVVVIVISTLSYYSSMHSDPTRCEVLLSKGFWLRPSQLLDWQPSGCRLYKYEAREASSCLGDRRVVMVGGTSMLTVYEAFVKLLNPDYRLPFLKDGADVKAEAWHISMEFYWDPDLNGAELNRIRAGYPNNSTRPALTIIGLERDNVKKNNAVTAWTAHIDSLLSEFQSTPGHAQQLTDSVILMPLLEPNIPRLSPSPIDMLNDVLASLATKYGVEVAFAFNDVVGPRNALVDGKFIVSNANDVMASILLNYRCNALMPAQYPSAGICCNSYPEPTWVQKLGIGMIMLLLLVAPVALLLDRRGSAGEPSNLSRFIPSHKYIGAALVLLSAVTCCWFLDRTNVFGKENKGWSQAQFVFVLVSTVVSLVGLHPSEQKDAAQASRSHLEEWKGILQVAILIYRYCDVSSTDYIYEAYLFITGCETTVEYLRDPESFSLKRIVTQLLRLNLLRVLLALGTSRDAQLYFFPIVLTVNYLITLAVLIPGRQRNGNDMFIIAKFIAVAAALATIYKIPSIVDSVAKILQAVFHVPGNSWQWQERLLQQPYAVFFGIAAGFVYTKAAPTIASLLSPAATRQVKALESILNNKYTAWLGRGWLESFLLQFHIWLAADSNGLLMVGLIPASQRLINVFVTTPMFFYVSWAVTNAVHGFIEWIMGPSGLNDDRIRSIPVVVVSEEEQEAPFMSDKVGLLGDPASVSHGLGISSAEQDRGYSEKDTSRLEDGPGPAEAVSTSRRSSASLSGNDWMLRVGVLVITMAVLSWTYYW